MTLTKNAAAFLNQYRIRVNQLNVGWTLHRGRAPDQAGRRARARTGWTRRSRRGRSAACSSRSDIAYAAAYFASDESACITGSVMDLEQYPVGAPPNW